MNITQLRSAIQNTPLITPEGDPEWIIADKEDRQRLMLLLTRDDDVMEELFYSVVEKMQDDGLDDATTNAVLAIHESKSIELAGFAGVFGAMFYGHLYAELDKHITDSAEDLLQLLRDTEREGCGDLEAFKNQRGVA